MKVLCMIPVWRRPAILNICIKKFNAPDYLDVEPVFILSPEDPDFDLNYKLTRNFRQFVYKNRPLGEKKNCGLRYFLQSDWDYYMDLGSDNVFTPALWAHYRSYFDRLCPFFGLTNGHFYDTLSERVIFVTDYAYDGEGKPFAWGGCRMIRRDIVERTGDLWRNEHHSGMDGMSQWNIVKATGIRDELVDTGEEPVIMNIITFVNINPISATEHRGKEVDVKWARRAFGIGDISLDIHLLTFNGFHTEVEKQAQQMPTKEDAFANVNVRYERAFGVPRFKNYETYRTSVYRTYKK